MECCTGAASVTGWAAWACWCFCWPVLPRSGKYRGYTMHHAACRKSRPGCGQTGAPHAPDREHTVRAVHRALPWPVRDVPAGWAAWPLFDGTVHGLRNGRHGRLRRARTTAWPATARTCRTCARCSCSLFGVNFSIYYLLLLRQWRECILLR